MILFVGYINCLWCDVNLGRFQNRIDIFMNLHQTLHQREQDFLVEIIVSDGEINIEFLLNFAGEKY